MTEPSATPADEIGLDERADVLWLARRLLSASRDRRRRDGVADTDDPGGEPEPGAPDGHLGPPPATAGSDPERYPAEPPVSVTEPAGGELHLSSAQRHGATDGGRAADLVSIPRPPALPRSLHLLHSLRPLNIRMPSPSDTELDEEATIRRQVDEDLLLPVLRPRSSRMLDLALVIDAGPSMHFWQDEVHELHQLLLQLGAFRDVRRWHLRPAGNGERVELFAPAEPMPVGRDPGELIDPVGHRLILHVTDGIGPLWRGAGVTAALRSWGRHQPVAVVSVLPRRLWRRTTLRTARRTVKAPRAAAPNALYRSEHPVPGIPIPLIELTPASLKTWSSLVGQGNRTVPLDLLRPAPRHRATGPSPHADHPTAGDDRARASIRAFRANASPGAWRLAGSLSAVPLTLPVMRLVAATMSEDTNPGVLAEVLLGGLIRRVESAAGAAEEFDFLPGVRSILLSAQFRDDVARVRALHESVGAQVRRHAGAAREFVAARPVDGRGDVTLPPTSAPFARSGDETSPPTLETPPAVKPPTDRPATPRYAVSSGRRTFRSTLRLHQLMSAAGRCRVALHLESEGRTYEAMSDVDFVARATDTEQLRWYLEDYLEFPVDPAPAIAARVEERIAEIGAELFASVFARDAGARTIWAEIRSRLDEVRVEVVADPVGTQLPWEMIRESRAGTPLALQVDSFVRVLVPPAMPARLPFPSGDKLRVLLVISRPAGASDVPFRSVANTLTRLAESTSMLQLDVLRPPTFSRLTKVLQEAYKDDRPYHAVHFDGHGVYVDAAEMNTAQTAVSSRLRYVYMDAWPEPRGYAVFEEPDSLAGQHLVSGAVLGALLTRTRVPVLTLNTCRSAYTEPTATRPPDDQSDAGGRSGVLAYESMAAEAVLAGVPGVLAMSHSVYVVTAAQFVADLYNGLLAGKSLGAAVTAGRRQLFAQPNRAITLDARPLQDWLVPIVYETTPLTLFTGTSTPPRPANDVTLDRRNVAYGLPSRPENGFFGRDEALLALDRAFDRFRVVLLHGYAGSGKTSTAVEFARWYAATGGIDEGVVLFSSLEQYTPLSRLLNQLADTFDAVLTANNISWFAMDDANRRALAIQLLAAVPVLWIWDNVEPVAGFPQHADSAWTADEQRDLADFLRDAATTKARVLLTSRRDESGWLGDLPARVALPAMAMRERFQLAQAIAARHVHRITEMADWRPLLRYSAGNPLTVAVLVGQALRNGITERAQMEAFIEQLRDGERALEDDEFMGRQRSLAASLGYGLASAFTAAERAQLAALRLFQDAVDVDVLVSMGRAGAAGGIPALAGLTREAGVALLDRAAELGLLSVLDRGWYSVHPALSQFLRRSSAADPDAGSRDEAAYTAAIAGAGVAYARRFNAGQYEAVYGLRVEEANLLRANGLARRAGRWDDAIGCLEGLRTLYADLGRGAAWARLVDELVPDLVDTAGEGPRAGLAEPWRHLTDYRIDLALDARDWVQAERLHQLCLRYDLDRAETALAVSPELLTEDDRDRIRNLADSEYKLGHILREQDRFECADHYARAAELAQRIGDRRIMGLAASHLGIAHLYVPGLRDLDTAELWSQRRLDLLDDADVLGRARAVMQVGAIAFERFRDTADPRHLERARAAYEEALAVLPPHAITDRGAVHNWLGEVHSAAGRFDTAILHLQRSIRYLEDGGDRFGAGLARHNIALALQEVGRHVDALLYARAALRDLETYGPGAASSIDGTRELIVRLGRDNERVEVHDV